MTGLKSIVMMLSALIMLLLVLTAQSFAGSVDLPKTGQITCYDADGNVIDCAETGQDGDIQAGVEWPEPRFEDNGDGTVTDHLTGLIWLRNANCFGKMTWWIALTYCNKLASGSCGLTDGSVAGDWRLPNIVELESLVNAEKSNLAAWLNSQGFSNVQLWDYWSATTLAFNRYYAWGVDMQYGNFYDGKSEEFYVWPVRAGQ
ncbi:MAG: DUF1566 domain-containing protein [Deltaproteobacteria bacterium]|nr:DUF1566 domain-containing protein [Deltaproteobacteria bacterium]